jgi:peptide/nickel transport system substrate-binding protein
LGENDPHAKPRPQTDGAKITVNRNQLTLFIVVMVVLLALVGASGYYAWRMLFAEPEVAASTTPSMTPGAATPAVSSTGDDATPDTQSTPVAENTGELSAQTAGMTSTSFVQAVGMPPVTFNPIYASDSAALTIIDKIYPRLLGQEPNGGFIVPSALAERWEISPDGSAYTFTLRDGIRWSDGEPVTSNDFKFTYEALASPLVESPYRDRTVGIVQIDAPDPRTVVVRLAGPNCAVLHSLRQPLLPSHKYAADFSDLATNPLSQAPTVSAGPFLFVERIGDEKVILARNPDYWQGVPQIEEWEVRIIPNPNDRRQALADDLVDLAYFDPDEVVETTLEAGEAVTVTYLPTDGYSFLALNLADPAAPQPGRASDGSSLPQAPHPILGDVAVRQAIAAAVDYDRILSEVYNGHAYRTASYVPSTVRWAYNDSLPLPSYDPARARQLLNDAGWVDEDGDSVLSRAGQPLRLSIRTNEDNPKRVEMARLIAEELTKLGVQVELNIASFDELTAVLLDQRFDLVVIGWENLGADPGNSPFWHSQADIPTTGFNFTSFHDNEVDGWLDSAMRLAGCDLNSRGDLYKQVQQRIASQLPYILLAAQEGAWVYQKRWQGIAPGPWEIDHNVASWRAQ